VSSIASLYVFKAGDLATVVNAAGSAQTFWETVHEVGEELEEAQYSTEETLSLLHDTIERLSDDRILLLNIG
jgi:hypothetical protein